MKLFYNNWYDKLIKELTRTKELKIISPFVQEQILRKIQSQFDFNNFELITRYKLKDFAMNVSSLDALKFSIEKGASIYGVRSLHSKVYLFDKRAAIITSANLTNGGLMDNLECGIFITDRSLILNLHDYFNRLKGEADNKLTIENCKSWERELLGIEIDKNIGRALTDLGAQITFFDKTKNYYIKFFGGADNRVESVFSIKEEIERSLCHYACCYPLKKKPKQVNDGDIIFMARMTKNPSDYAIFGKATALKYTEGRDKASDQEIKERPKKNKWPIYLRVKDPIFINGEMKDGILLSDLINEFKYNSFSSTKQNFDIGKGNIDPRKSLMRKPHIKLTHASAEWLEQRFKNAITHVGAVDETFIENLPQPKTDFSLSVTDKILF